MSNVGWYRYSRRALGWRPGCPPRASTPLPPYNGGGAIRGVKPGGADAYSKRRFSGIAQSLVVVLLVCLLFLVLLLLRASVVCIESVYEASLRGHVAVGRQDRVPEYTIVIPSTKQRVPVLVRVVEHYATCPNLTGIVVVWNARDEVPADVMMRLQQVTDGRIFFRTYMHDSLNNRFFPDEGISTEAILSLDDDMLISCGDVVKALRVWMNHTTSLVGFLPRLVGYHDGGMDADGSNSSTRHDDADDSNSKYGNDDADDSKSKYGNDDGSNKKKNIQDEYRTPYSFLLRPLTRMMSFARWARKETAMSSWLYQSERQAIRTGAYNIMLTPAMVYSRRYMDEYWKEKYQKFRTFVDMHHNCEDILMNYIVAHANTNTTAPHAVFVRPKKRLDISKRVSAHGISRYQGHMKTREECVAFFESSFRVSPGIQRFQWSADGKPPWCSLPWLGCVYV